METDRVTRIDSRSMAAILLDVDGVFHVSGRPIDGVGEAIRRLRDDGHRLRFVTNNTTSSRADLADDLRALGVELDDEELETTPRAAARTLAGKRVLALTMAAIRPELEGVELVGDEAEAVLLGGADETDEPNRRLKRLSLSRTQSSTRSGTCPDSWHGPPRIFSGNAGGRRPDRDRADSARARTLFGVRRALLHRGGARVLRQPRQPGPALCGAVRRQGGSR